MPANTTPIFPVTPIIGIATLTGATAITTYVNITGTTGLTQLTATSTNGTRIDTISVLGKATTVASKITIWLYDGTTSYVVDEILITAVTLANTTAEFSAQKSYTTMVLPPTYQLFISQTVSTNVNVLAYGGQY
jgi:hypothetical protein